MGTHTISTSKLDTNLNYVLTSISAIVTVAVNVTYWAMGVEVPTKRLNDTATNGKKTRGTSMETSV